MGAITGKLKLHRVDGRTLASVLAMAGILLVFLLYGTDLVGKDPRQTLTRNITTPMYDDGFYYLQIAKNLALGNGSSFDGIHPTNGYHPLWLWNLVPIFWLGAGSDLAVLFTATIQSHYFAITLYFIFLTARLYFGRYTASLAAMAWAAIQTSYWMALSGMEYGLHAMLLTITLYYFLSRFGRSGDPLHAGSYFLLGLLCAATSLARLDAALLVPLLALFLWLRAKNTQGTIRAGRYLLAFAAPPVLVLGAYLWLNYLVFDLAVPVSGLLKRDWSATLLEADPVYQSSGWLGAKLAYLLWPASHLRRAFWVPLTAGVFGVPALWILLRQIRVEAATELGAFLNNLQPFIWFAIAQYLMFAAVYHGGFSFQPWHFVAPLLLAALCGAALVSAVVTLMAGRWPAFRRFGIVLALAVWCAAPLYSLKAIWHWKDRQRAFSQTEPFQPAAKWISETLPEKTVIGAWNAGSLAFFSGRTVVNLDGLVNSRQFFESDRFDLCSYLQANEIDYVADVFERGNELAFIHRTYAPQTDLSPCFSRWALIWTGAAYPGTNRSFEVFRVAGGPHE